MLFVYLLVLKKKKKPMKASFPRHMSGGNRGDEVCLFVVCCLFALKKKMKLMKASFPRHMSGGGRGGEVCLFVICLLFVDLFVSSEEEDEADES